MSKIDGENDGNAPPYPGVIIEEMIDSASQIGSPEDSKEVTKIGHSEVSALHFSYEKLCIMQSQFVI